MMKRNQPDSSPNSNEGFELSAQKEREILLRVKKNLDREYFKTQSQTPWLLWTLPAVASVFAVLWLLPKSSQTPNPIQTQGQVQLQQQSQSQYEASTQNKQQGQLEHKGQWKLKLLSHTRVQLRSRQKRHTLRLHSGKIQIYVAPRQTKSFIVQSGQLSVHVRGTLFSVQRTPKGERVEVRRGKVALFLKEKEELELTAGQGALLQLNQRLQRYSLQTNRQPPIHNPPSTTPHPQPSVHKPKKAERLRRWVDQQIQQGKIKQARQGLWALYKLQLSNGTSENALFESAQLCRRHTRRWFRHCSQSYQRYLKHYPQGLWKEHALFWYANAQTQQYPKRTPKPLQTYLKRYPQGHYTLKARWLLAQWSQRTGQPCAKIRVWLLPKQQHTPWFQKLCPNP